MGDVDGQYFLFECKNEVDENRSEINKIEAGQMNNHCGWFADEYGNAKCKNHNNKHKNTFISWRFQ